MTLAKDPSEQAKRFIDASLKGRGKPPSKAAYARAQLNQLVSDLNAILSAMEGLATINALIADLARIENQEETLEALVKKVQKERIKQALQD